jgi:hypothetical protein
MDSLQGFDFDMNMGTGYFLCTNQKYRKKCGKKFYTIYHEIICDQIKKNNIKNVNGLIRWIDAVGYYPDYVLLFDFSLKCGTIEMFLMIYYICVFWSDCDSNYINYNIITMFFNSIKSTICNDFLIINSLKYVPKEVVLLMMKDLLDINVIDYHFKVNAINEIYNHYGSKLSYTYDEMLEDNDEKHDAFESFIHSMLIKYNIDMKKINTEFYDEYEDQHGKLMG